MHAVACFLFDYEDPEMSIPEIVDHVDDAIDGFIGEDVPWKIEQLILQSGAYLIGESNTAITVSPHPKAWTVEHAVDFATQTVAVDFELFGADMWENGKVNPGNAKIDELKRADLLMEIHNQMSAWLVRQYMALQPVGDRGEDYKRFKKVQSFEYLRLAYYAPFSVYGSLYEHRAFDVRGEKSLELGAMTGVALIDYHA